MVIYFNKFSNECYFNECIVYSRELSTSCNTWW